MSDPIIGNNGCYPRRWRRLVCPCLCLVIANPAGAQAFLEDMRLIGFGGSGQSSIAASFRVRSAGLSDGSRYSLRRYYSTNFKDLRLTMLSPVDRNFGIIWGFGTGERGEKYRIEPSVKIGFLATQPVGESGLLSLSVTTVLGGYFREGSCTADYGAIGGVQEVNCRMADSFLPPAETLNYLVSQPPGDQLNVSMRYSIRF